MIKLVGLNERKIRQSGDSKVVALPPDWLRFHRLDVGDKVEVIALSSIVVIMPKNSKLNSERIRQDIDFLLSTHDKFRSDES